MPGDQGRMGRGDLMIDFATESPPPRVAFADRLCVGDVTFADCALRPITGFHIGSPQITVAIHIGAPFRLEWRLPGADRHRTAVIPDGHAHIVDADRPFWMRCRAAPRFLAIALDRDFVRSTWSQAFDGHGVAALQTVIDMTDPVIRRLAALARCELRDGGSGGRLYAESLATALAVHLLRRYGTAAPAQARRTGGLGPAPFRRVIDYINANLNGELALAELAAVARLSPHHFGAAFKTTSGVSPHRYVIERRVERARALLRDRQHTLPEVALAAGFASQSHLTVNFRRVTGLTPARYRRALE